MLVLSRRTSQQIMIGPEIRITVVRIERNQVRLGIQAPPGVPILRNELADAPRASAPPRPADPPAPSRSGAGASRDRGMERTDGTGTHVGPRVSERQNTPPGGRASSPEASSRPA